MSTTPTHTDASVPDILFGDASIGEQPSSAPPFRFGLQPQILKGVDRNNETHHRAVIAAGDVWRKFSKWALDHRGTEYSVFDPGLHQDDDPLKVAEPQTAAAKKARAGVDDAHCLSSLDNLPPDIKSALIQCTPDYHTHYINWAQELGLPAMVEKPLVNDVAEFADLDKLLENPKASLYCMDWMAAHALPLAAVIGKATGTTVSFADAVHYQNEDKLSRFDFNHIDHIVGALVEKPVGNYGDMDYVKKVRPDVYKAGALKDMGVHPMAALVAMGFMPGKVSNVVLGDTEGQKSRGVYRRIGNGEDAPAWYARAEMTSHFRGQEIPTIIEAAKGAAEDDSHITLTDRKGNVLRWEFGHEKSAVTLRLKGEKAPVQVAEAWIDPYALMFEEAQRLFDREKNSPRKTALYYQSQRAVLHAVAEMEKAGRLCAAQPADTVKQIALEPHTTVDLADAVTRKGPQPEKIR